MEKLNAEQAQKVIHFLNSCKSYRHFELQLVCVDWGDMSNSDKYEIPEKISEKLMSAHQLVKESLELGLKPTYIDNLIPGVIKDYWTWECLRKPLDDKTKDGKKVVQFSKDEYEVF